MHTPKVLNYSEMNILMSNIQHLKASFHIYLDYVRERTEMEDIHKLRVTIRKLKVLYALIEFSLPEKFSKNNFNEPLKVLFSRAGRVRENQINLLHVQKLELKYLQPYLGYLSLALKRNLRNLKKSVGNFELEKFDEQCEFVLSLLARFDDDWSQEKIAAYTFYKYEKIAQLKATPENEVVLHKIRKRVRSIIDALSMLKKSARKNSPVPFAEIKKINDELGKWHDGAVLFHSLVLFERRHVVSSRNKWLTNFIVRGIHDCKVKEEHLLSLLQKL